MLRGTIACIGFKGREFELLEARLVKDGYETVSVSPTTTVYGKIAKTKPQAVLVTDRCTKYMVDGIAATTKKFKTKVPLIMVTTDQESALFEAATGLGEVWRLHDITLAECMKRLRFAIQLCQLA